MNPAVFLEQLRATIAKQKVPRNVDTSAAEIAAMLEGADVFIGGALKKGKGEVGRSKVGGKPDLPAGFEWPHEEGEEDAALGFVAQINLAEVHPHDLAKKLPAKGMLWFFSILDANRAGGCEIDTSTTAVRFDSEPKGLKPHRLPEAFLDDEDAHIGERGITFGPCVSIASHDADVQKVITKALQTLGGQRGPVSMLVPGENGLDLASFDGYEIAPNAFGEGFLDFVITEKDLREGQLEATDIEFSGGT